MPRIHLSTEQKASVIHSLLRFVADGKRLAILQTHTSRSGMQRRYRVFGVDATGRIESLTRPVALLCGLVLKEGARDEIVINGCNFSGAHEIASDVARCLGVRAPFDEM